MKNDNNLNKYLTKILILSLIITIMLPMGILMIIFGASKSIWIILAFGIVFTVIGFYGCPIIWIYYANNKTMKRVIEIINDESLYSIDEISSHIQISKIQIKNHITNAIKKGYLQGYIFDGNILKINEKEQISKKTLIQKKCPNCGGLLIENNNEYYCEYCGSKFKNNK